MSEKRETTIYRCGYSRDIHRTMCQALTITRLTHSPYATKIGRIRCYTMPSTIFKLQDVEHTISVYIECQDVEHTISVYINCQDVQRTISVFIKCQDVQHTISAYIKS